MKIEAKISDSVDQFSESINNAVLRLKTKGYNISFRIEATCIYSPELNAWINPGNFTVDEYYYFEDKDYADRDRMLYAITANKKYKGYIIDTCFVYEDNISTEMWHKLNPITGIWETY